ncbi:hypothetical protein PR202_ga25535 [Eleusine coracana subsp. coracana]|uniref:DUF659 domain-containing protein n=1 Tax=Eleusine coracana subsp. coracana TaxID=191504 RepID=A0AAV5DBK8_ELECO|nr:hypothetical protein PR202_ga25535 [Eleusine coracana subsp. coracana]
MASPNMSSASASASAASVESANTHTTDIKAPLWDHVTILERPKTGGGNALWRCKYCPMQKLSSYTRVEAHLLQKGRQGIGYVIPGYNRAREGLLKQERRHIENLLYSTKSTWAEKGVTICSDGQYKSKEYIAEKLKGIIEEVGRHNVVQIITDNAANCKGAGLIIESEYDNIFWTPCVVHTLNLALNSICEPKIGNNPSDEEMFVWGELQFIYDVKTEAALIKNFIMNHGMRLSMFNQFSRLKLLSIAETRFASVVCMLRRFVEVKTALQQMVISDRWNVYREVRDDSSTTPTAQVVKELIYLVMYGGTRYYSKRWLEEGVGREPPHKDKEVSKMRMVCFKKFFPMPEELAKVKEEYSRNWSTYSFVHSVKRNALTPERAEDLVFVHSNLRHLSRRTDAYKTGETRMWDVGGDSFDSLGGIGILEVADLSLDEPELQSVTFGLDAEAPQVDDNETNEE